MSRRGKVLGWGVGAVLAALGLWAAVRAAVYVPVGDLGSRTTRLFFDAAPWGLGLASFVGLWASAFCKRVDPRLEGDRVLRHDAGAMLAHWTVGLSCVALLYTGFALGLFRLPRQVVTASETAFLLNLHFVAALFFLFGVFFWVGNTVRSPARLREHLPGRIGEDLRGAAVHYAHLLRLTRRTVEAGKYQASERLAFVPIVAVTGVLVVSGFFKVFARIADLPAPLISLMHWLHDAGTVLMLVLVVMHVVLGALVPWSWPLLRSMLTGYLPAAYARAHHGAWFRELAARKGTRGPHADPADPSRRRFVQALGATGVALSAGGMLLWPGGRIAIPNAEGFLVVDPKKCMGCNTCMASCAVAHTGGASLSLARIQIRQDPFARWPDDVAVFVCRQCQDAACVKACPVSANRADPAHGGVRRVDPDRCIGCMQCLEACPYSPKRIQWDTAARKAQKCDLCADTPFMEAEGGPGGVQACVRACPVNAIAFVREMPDQDRLDSYRVNLRGEGWARMGMTTKP